MYSGTVYQIDLSLGKGLIAEANGNLIMFLLSSVIGTALKEEDKVVYDIGQNHSRMAINVRKIS